MTADPNIGALLGEVNRLRAGEVGAAEDPLPLRRILGMRLGNELYGIDIEHITEIIKLPPITYVPGAPIHILGVTSLRGQIVPIINMRMILGVETDHGDSHGHANGTPPLKPRIVVLHYNDTFVGLLVDSVTEVYDLRAVVEPPLGGPARGFQIKEGQMVLGERILILLHVPALFSQLAES